MTERENKITKLRTNNNAEIRHGTVCNNTCSASFMPRPRCMLRILGEGVPQLEGVRSSCATISIRARIIYMEGKPATCHGYKTPFLPGWWGEPHNPRIESAGWWHPCCRRSVVITDPVPCCFVHVACLIDARLASSAGTSAESRMVRPCAPLRHLPSWP